MAILVDTTLRDGEQAPGVAFSVEDKVRIALALSRAGIREIEAGTPIMGGVEAEAVRAVVEAIGGTQARIFAWNRVIEKDIEASLSCGVGGLYVSCPVSDIQIRKKLNKTRSWVKDRFLKLMPEIKKTGAYVACGLEDASRADEGFLTEVSCLLEERGADRIRICDTVGVLTPSRTFRLATFLKERISIPIEIHAHNDFGLATANAIAGIEAGAMYASVTINGMGERAGNASLEEVVMAAEKLLNMDTGIDTRELKTLSELVSGITGRPIPFDKPIVGECVLTHESGIHVDGVLKDPSCYEPFSPDEIDGERRIMIGKHSASDILSRILLAGGKQNIYRKNIYNI